MDASKITSGTLDASRLPANLALLDRSPQTLSGEGIFSSSTQLSERLRLSGQESYESGNTDTDGFSLGLGVNRAADLKTLLGIEITDYTYRDTLAKGNQPQKKVTAQQVEQVYPQAVNRSTDEVPDIYQWASIKDGWVELASDLKVGERVKLIGEKQQGIYPVLEVRDGAFRTDFQPKGDRGFVYGREVDDFRTVDYEAIAMLNVSATQELHRELMALKSENAALRGKNTELERRLDGLERLLERLALAEIGGEE